MEYLISSAIDENVIFETRKDFKEFSFKVKVVNIASEEQFHLILSVFKQEFDLTPSSIMNFAKLCEKYDLSWEELSEDQQEERFGKF